uniref:RNase H type-1 domain-containing protein n=1 Tax=Chenopodium quinoa TaxID=63459 RepID=A0A803MR21_CHEQI
MLVSDLFDCDKGEWCTDMLDLHLTREDSARVHCLPLSKRCPADVRYWWPTNDGIYTTKCVPARSSWEPTSVGTVKVNTDAAMLAGLGVGLSAVFRDDTGKVLAVCVKRCPGDFSVKLAEAMAARHGVLAAKELGFYNIELGGDALSIFNAIKQKQEGRTPFNLVIEDILEVGKSFNYFAANHVKRNGNVVAHFAARFPPPPPYGLEVVFSDSIPQGINALAELDVN